MDDIDDKRQIKIVLFRHAFEVTDLRFVAIDQSYPGFHPRRIPIKSLIQRLADDLIGLFFETGPHAFLLRTGSRLARKRAVSFSHHIFRGTDKRRNCVNRGHSGHTLGIFLFSFGQPLAHFVGSCLGGLSGLLAKILCAHHNPLAIDAGHQYRTSILILGSRVVP